MRIATASWYSAQTATMLSLQAEAARRQTDIATGKRMQSAADDPGGAARADALIRADAQLRQWHASGTAVRARLEAADSALRGMTEVLQRVEELALAAASDTLNPEDRNSIAVELRGLHAQLLTFANSRDAGGEPLFAGASTADAFAADADGRIVYRGIGEPRAVTVGDAAAIAASLRGDLVLGSPAGTDAAATAFDLIDGLTDALSGSIPETPESRAERQAAVDAALIRLKPLQARVTDANAGVGLGLVRIEAEQLRIDARILDMRSERSGIEDTDVTEAAVTLERALTLLQATQATFGEIARLSLFDRL